MEPAFTNDLSPPGNGFRFVGVHDEGNEVVNRSFIAWENSSIFPPHTVIW